ncbi:PREDICTED: uncharacterized protein LOC104821925 [Tarenaya hassleriana]|uniref:uncharacterized protein LOC104821925 n=1 Tax=Tarenaya hassleriana TaxID=28532 RepID=UPI00053CA58C|nr:PREDICTED: uncharacterized protein LOC104821925 [Tarenaya hassleriana]
MEIPVINRISDFEVGLNSINDPSFVSRAFAVSGFGKFYHAYSFWKWGALIIAFLASFTTLITRIKILILRLRKIDLPLPSSPLLDDYDSDSDLSCSSSDEADTDEEEDEEEESSVSWRRVDGDFHVRGSGYYIDDNDQGLSGNFMWRRRRRSGSFGDLFSWPDLAGLGGSGVVKLWDHLDFDKRRDVSAAQSSPVVLAAEGRGSDAVEVSAWDPRAGIRVPAMLAEWRGPRRMLGRIAGVSGGGVEKIYVRDDVSGEITVGDMRMVNAALTDLTESDVDTWWDADSVITADVSVDGTR